MKPDEKNEDTSHQIEILYQICELLEEALNQQNILLSHFFKSKSSLVKPDSIGMMTCRDKKLRKTNRWCTDLVVKVFYHLKNESKLDADTKAPKDLLS